jgi:AraC family transcriptional regulator, activator of mtrCDE
MILDKLLSNLMVDVGPFTTCELASGWRLGLPTPPRVSLHFVLKGSGEISGLNGEQRALEPLSLAIVPIGMKHSLETRGPIRNNRSINSVSSNPSSYRIVAGPSENPALVVAYGMLDVQYGQALNLFHNLKQILVVDLSPVQKLPELFEEIFIEQRQLVPGSDAMTGALMTQCLLHMFRRLPTEGDRAMPWLVSLQDPRIGRVIEGILDDPAYPHTIESLSAQASMSRSAFFQRFTDMFGRPPIGYVHQIRMQLASDMLTASSLSIDEVAKRVGISSRSHFTHSFKKHTGISPHAFREITTRSKISKPF